MNMQTQIDLFPLGTCYYSQILISLQIPPVPIASPTRFLPGQDPGARNGHQQKKGYPGPHRVDSQEERPALGQQGVPATPGELRAVHLLTGRQLTEPFCHVLDSSPRGTAAAAAEAETGLVTLGKGKPTCFQLSPNQPLDYDGNKSVSATTPAPGKEGLAG